MNCARLLRRLVPGLRRLRTDRGATAVEFALIVPVLVLFVFGIVDFGRAYNVQLTLTEASREGARAVALHTAGGGNAATLAAIPSNYSGSVTVTTTVATLSGVSLGTSVCPGSPSTTDPPYATVKAAYVLSTVTPALPAISISGTAVMRCSG